MKVIDLFCGAGGLSSGFEAAGFSVLVGNDNDGPSGETFAKMHPHAKFLSGNVQKFSPIEFMQAAGIKPGQLECMVGGPPCQGFSVYNHQRGLHDERSGMYLEYLRLVQDISPEWVVIENVTGMASTGGGEVIEKIISGLQQLGYAVDKLVMRSEDYGVPQERRRIVFVGNRIGADFVWPEKTHGKGLLPFVNVRDAISDLPLLKNGEDLGIIPYATAALSEYQKMLRKSCGKLVFNHSAPKLGALNIERMKHIPAGGSWRDIPHELLPEGMKRAKRSDHTKRYGRLTWEGLASTILTKCDIHWGAYLHPEQDRVISVREAARFQSFPDSYVFSGSRTEQYVQVGNAVPPLMAQQLASAIRQASQKVKRLAA